MRSRRGTSLVEALVMLVPALLILCSALMLMVRSASHDSWNDARLGALDAALIAGERLQHDIACNGAAGVEATGEALALEAVSKGAKSERVTWTHARGNLVRNTAPLRAAPLAAVSFEMTGPVVKMVLKTADLPVQTTAYLREHAAAAELPSWGAMP